MIYTDTKLREHDIKVGHTDQAEERPVYYDRNGDPGSPGCPAETEICEVWYNCVDVFDLLCDECISEIEELILKG